MTQTGTHMPTFEQGQVVRVPFPYTDRPVRQFRPALVISRGTVGLQNQLVWVLMITSAENRSWPGDINLGEHFADFGLPAPSMIRTAKIATVDAPQIEVIGRLNSDLLERTVTEVNRLVQA